MVSLSSSISSTNASFNCSSNISPVILSSLFRSINSVSCWYNNLPCHNHPSLSPLSELLNFFWPFVGDRFLLPHTSLGFGISASAFHLCDSLYITSRAKASSLDDNISLTHLLVLSWKKLCPDGCIFVTIRSKKYFKSGVTNSLWEEGKVNRFPSVSSVSTSIIASSGKLLGILTILFW